MATYTFIPNSWTGYDTITNPSNAYADTGSDNYASVDNITGDEAAYLGFDFAGAPFKITSITVKVKASYIRNYGTMQLYSSSNGIALSNRINITSDVATVYTFTLTSSVDDISWYLDTLCIRFRPYATSQYSIIHVYGAEVIIEGGFGVNKVEYSNRTLIDLTGDTATEADVVVGKTFHLANGLLGTGTYVPPVLSLNKKTASPSSSRVTSLAFTDLTKAPSFFVALPNSSIDTSFSGFRAICFLYNGETTYKIQGSYTNGSTKADIKASSAAFTYSSGTLTVKSSGSIYILTGGWNLFYI